MGKRTVIFNQPNQIVKGEQHNCGGGESRVINTGIVQGCNISLGNGNQQVIADGRNTSYNKNGFIETWYLGIEIMSNMEICNIDDGVLYAGKAGKTQINVVNGELISVDTTNDVGGFISIRKDGETRLLTIMKGCYGTISTNRKVKSVTPLGNMVFFKKKGFSGKTSFDFNDFNNIPESEKSKWNARIFSS